MTWLLKIFGFEIIFFKDVWEILASLLENLLLAVPLVCRKLFWQIQWWQQSAIIMSIHYSFLQWYSSPICYSMSCLNIKIAVLKQLKNCFHFKEIMCQSHEFLKPDKQKGCVRLLVIWSIWTVWSRAFIEKQGCFTNILYSTGIVSCNF